MYEKEKEFIRRCEETMNGAGKSHVVIYSTEIERALPFKLALKEVVVKNGMVEFIFMNGEKMYVEDKNITRNIHNGKKIYSANKDESYIGKKSILKRHAKLVEAVKFSESNPDRETESYSTGNIMEFICDGIAIFALIDNAIKRTTAPKPEVTEEEIVSYIKKNYRIPSPDEFRDFLYGKSITA